jgi:Ca2+-binding RTX toxin-like protein
MSSRSVRGATRIRVTIVSIIVASPLMLVGSLSAAATFRGAEPVMCFGRVATIVGTVGNDQYPDAVNGTTGSDVVHALAGHDNVYAVALEDDQTQEVGDDYICAGSGNDDPVDGGGGNDHIAGGPGSDSLFGNEGNDTILGGYGIDEIESHDGRDVVDGGPGGDELCASGGRDVIRGADGNDTIGGCGDPSTGVDRYLGGPGDDVIFATDFPEQISPDEVNGGSGNDTCWIDPGDTATNCETVEVV